MIKVLEMYAGVLRQTTTTPNDPNCKYITAHEDDNKKEDNQWEKDGFIRNGPMFLL